MLINREQEKIAFTKPNGFFVVKGIAGSGKTTVGIYRIPFLVQNYVFEHDDEVLYITFNKTLVNYINYLRNKIEPNLQQTLYSIFDVGRDRVKVMTLDSLIYGYFRRNIEKQGITLGKEISFGEKREILLDEIRKEGSKFSEGIFFSENNLSVIFDEINWIKASNFTELEGYLSEGKISILTSSGTRISKDGREKIGIFEISKRYTEALNKKGNFDFHDVRRVALEEIRASGGTKYTHIILDESQDLSRSQIEFLLEIYKGKEYSSFTFLYDSAQSIYPHAWLGRGERSFSSVGINILGRSKTLSKNFRTTTEISKVAFSLLSSSHSIISNDDFVKPSLIDRHGKKPIMREFESFSKEGEFLINEIERLKGEYNYGEIALVARGKNNLKEMEKFLQNSGIPCKLLSRQDGDFESDMVKLYTMHSIKGIESRVVFVFDINEGVLPIRNQGENDFSEVQERKLFYVAMTRAVERLYLTSWGTPSKFLREIDPKLLCYKEDTRLRHAYGVSIEEYKLKEKIGNIYGNEEKVRQWLLSELIDSYGFPLEVINIEFPITVGSKRIFADIAIIIKGTPLMLIEVKSESESIDTGISQLKSYLTFSPTSLYGVITNGKEFRVFDRMGKELLDIPNFDILSESSTESSTGSFIFEKINSDSIYQVNYIGEDIQFLENGGDEMLYFKSDEIRKVPIFDSFTMSSEDYEAYDYVELPKTLVGEDSFAMKIRGESMNPTVNDGDVVIFNKSQNFRNQDIISVAIDERSVVKRYVKMGSSILLTCDNEEFEPLYFNEQDIRNYIIGKGIAVLREFYN